MRVGGSGGWAGARSFGAAPWLRGAYVGLALLAVVCSEQGRVPAPLHAAGGAVYKEAGVRRPVVLLLGARTAV